MSIAAGHLKLAFLGDDFTGSAATMEAFAFAGVPTVLFLDIPDADQLARFPDAQCIGIATTARSHSPKWMDDNLPRYFDFLKNTGAPVIHYKICSTLDSAPHVGSVGKALDIAQEQIASRWIPCLLAAPQMRRYQAFGNLFAGMPEGVFRLDRHPVMARHPVTPMDEADVGRHLAKQTQQAFGLITVEDLASAPHKALDRELENGAKIIPLDAMTQGDMARCGQLIWQSAAEGQLLCTGSQGIEYALVSHWREAGEITEVDLTEGAGPVDRMIAVSGSVSPITAQQIDWAQDNGFAPIRLDVCALLRGDEAAIPSAISAALTALDDRLDPLIFSARGRDDDAVADMRQLVAETGMAEDEANARIGEALGRILHDLLLKTGIRRAVISGGDTSGHASRQLGIFAFTALSPTTPGAGLLAAHSDRPELAGLQLALKGGQMGSLDYFGWIKRGGGAAGKENQ